MHSSGISVGVTFIRTYGNGDVGEAPFHQQNADLPISFQSTNPCIKLSKVQLLSLAHPFVHMRRAPRFRSGIDLDSQRHQPWTLLSRTLAARPPGCWRFASPKMPRVVLYRVRVSRVPFHCRE